MTANESAKQIVESKIEAYQITHHPWSEGIIVSIEQAIIAAEEAKVEEERVASALVAEQFTRFAEAGRLIGLDIRRGHGRATLDRIIAARVKEEREACEKIIKKEIERWDRESIVELRESILIEIRARSEGQTKEKTSDCELST